MNKMILGLASAAALALTLPVMAQQKTIEVPKDVFYAGLGPTQYPLKARFIGQPVVDKAGARLGVVDDVILGSKDNAIDGFIMDVGGKKLGFRMSAAKVEVKEGKATISLPQVTGDMVKVLPAFGTKK